METLIEAQKVEHRYWEEGGKSWYQYINSAIIYREKDEAYQGKSFKRELPTHSIADGMGFYVASTW